MQSVQFCPKCGTSIQPDFIFCVSCGFALSTVRNVTPENTSVESAAPVQNTPMAAEAPKTVTSAKAKVSPITPRVQLLIIILLLAGAGFWIWYNETQNKNSSATGNDLTKKKSGYTGREDHTIPSFVKLKEFAGVWRIYESSDARQDHAKPDDPKDDLFIDVVNGTLDIYPREEKDREHSATFTCNEVVGNTISCKGISKEDDEVVSLKLEMQSSKNELWITITPNTLTETMIVKARRVAGADD